jgi:hypothetical protein
MIRVEIVASMPTGEEHSMLRALLIGVTFSAALSTAVVAQGQFGTLAEAKGPKIATEAASKVARNQKVCRSKKPDGTVKTWTCRTDQPGLAPVWWRGEDFRSRYLI